MLNGSYCSLVTIPGFLNAYIRGKFKVYNYDHQGPMNKKKHKSCGELILWHLTFIEILIASLEFVCFKGILIKAA